MDLAPWLDNVNNRKYHGMYYSPAAIAATVGTELTTSKVWQVGNNNSGFDSPAYQQLATSLTTETDSDKLKQLYKQANDLLLDESFGIPLAWRPPSNLTRATLERNRVRYGLNVDNLKETTDEEVDAFLNHARRARGPLDPGPQYEMRANAMWLHTRPDFAKLHMRVLRRLAGRFPSAQPVITQQT